MPIVIVGRSHPHDGSDNSWKIIAVGTTRDDDACHADEKAKSEITRRVNLHTATLKIAHEPLEASRLPSLSSLVMQTWLSRFHFVIKQASWA